MDKLDGTYYLLDCLDGIIGDTLLTATELSNRLYGQDRGLTERDIKHIAADYEAELHRYIYRDGEEVETHTANPPSMVKGATA
jgi:hypothetical protein